MSCLSTDKLIAEKDGAIAVRTKIIPLDFGTVPKNVTHKKIQNVFISWRKANQPFMSGALHMVYHSKGRMTGLSPASPELDRLLDELNEDEYLEDYGEKQSQVAKVLCDPYLAIPLMEVGHVFAAKADLDKVWPHEVNADEMNRPGIR